MHRLLFIAVFCLSGAFVNAQNKVLVFYNGKEKASVQALIQTAMPRGIILDTTSTHSVFSENTLRNYIAVVFLNVSANLLTFREAAELQRFIQAGGGFAASGKAAEAPYKWLWYQKMLGGQLAVNQFEGPVQLNLITNTSIGKTTLPPLWKITDKPLVFKELPTRFKPVLLDVSGKTWAWYRATDEGKFFYTALGCEPEAFQSPDFINHLWAGIEEVAAKVLPDYTQIAGTALPDEKYFLKIVLTSDLQNPLVIAPRQDNSVLIVEESGAVKLYDAKKREVRLLGKIEVPDLKGIRLDPEYTQNGYVYTFARTTPEEYAIGRMQITGDTALVMTDFKGTYTSPLAISAVYDYEKYAREPYRLPRYYDRKSFRYDNEQGFVAETIDEGGNVKNIEPFLQEIKFDSVRDLAFGADGNLYFLENNQLKKIDYSEVNRKPVAMVSADVLAGNVPLKIRFSSEGSSDFDTDSRLSFEWNFDGINQSADPNPEFTFIKPGNYEVKLKVTDPGGETAVSSLKIQANKVPVKPRKR